MKTLNDFFKTKESDIVCLIGSGSSLNDLTPAQWKFIAKHDNFGINNIFYHPTFVPKYLTMEIKHYDFEPSRIHIERKWEKGWKDVHYILASDRAEYTSKVIGHQNEAKIYTYDYIKRGEHPKKNPNVKINADYDPNTRIYKSYDASISAVIQMLYLMNYEKIILFGIDMIDSFYFWSHLDPKIYGPFHDMTNKAREGKDPKLPHNASHLKDFVIDFNEKHMRPKGREICIVSTKTALYPALKLLKFTTKEK
jgi:hypothetical protein